MSKVYEKISAIQGALAKVGIAKEGTNTQQNYKFRGIDQVYAALSPLLAEHGLCVLPRMVDIERSERVSIKPGYNGGQPKESVLFYVTVTAEFDFVAVEDGSRHTVRTYGEAMDSGDKATNKAMSAAYKYAAFMAFAIPTEGDNDDDAQTHEVAYKPDAKPREKLEGPYSSMTALKTAYQKLDRDIRQCESLDELDGFLELDHTKQLIAQLQRYANGYVVGSEKLPPEHVPLDALIAQCRESLVQLHDEADRMVNTYRAG